MPSYGAAAGPSAAAATPPPTAAAPAQRRAHHALLAALVGGLAVAGWVSSSRGLAATLSVKPGADVTPESLAALAQSGCQHLAVSYGKHPSQVLNLWEAEGKGPRPLIVEIHGGGWTQQDYRQVLPGTGYVPLGISYASIEYRRLCDDQVFSRTDPRAKDCGPLPAPVLDAARALQFIKSKAKEWNIDPDRIILKGGSAGGCSALWLNYHPDLADPTSADPVARQSTKVLATIANSAQSTIDPKTINGWGMGPQVLEHFMMRDAVGVISKAGPTKAQLAMYKEYSPIEHLTKHSSGSASPVFMKYTESSKLPCTQRACIHHSTFGIKLKEKADKLGAETYLQLGDAPSRSKLTWRDHTYKTEVEFVVDKLGMNDR